MKLLLNICLIAVVLSVVACENVPKETQTVKRYFDVDSLISGTIQKTLQNKDSLQINKIVEIDGEEEQKSFYLDQEGLENEMRLFSIMDLNNPALAFSYDSQESDGRMDYRLKATENQTGIISLSVTKKGNAQILEALFSENNPIYYTSRQLKLRVENGTIQSFEMTGKQKMVFKDTIHYSMKGIITN
ncbi:MAG: hypothetical protein AAFQ94_07715 [Bacteroidota bacterium]